tara:strand:+ start:33 stop:353 length:321 start_codon:yes stop_codon:yes gene_type:complete
MASGSCWNTLATLQTIPKLQYQPQQTIKEAIMIYIIWELTDELVPRLTAFKNKSDAHKYLKECELTKIEIEQQPVELQVHFDYALWEVPFSTTQTDMVKNITRKCI